MSRLASLLVVAVVAVATVMFLAPPSHAQEAKPISLSLFDPVQIVNRDNAVHGFRFNLIYGNNAGIKGVDIGLVNRNTGSHEGFQWGVVNWTEGDFSGWQTGPVGNVGGKMTGLQTAMILSMNDSGKGVMWSGGNISDNFVGLQVGLVNYAIEYHGIQIGLINIIKHGGMLPIFPFFNFSFD